MEPIKLTGKQEIESIRVEPADNGGCVLRYTIYTPTGTKTESSWNDQVEVYKDDEFEDVVLPRIADLYRTQYSQKKSEQRLHASRMPKV